MREHGQTIVFKAHLWNCQHTIKHRRISSRLPPSPAVKIFEVKKSAQPDEHASVFPNKKKHVHMLDLLCPYMNNYENSPLRFPLGGSPSDRLFLAGFSGVGLGLRSRANLITE